MAAIFIKERVSLGCYPQILQHNGWVYQALSCGVFCNLVRLPGKVVWFGNLVLQLEPNIYQNHATGAGSNSSTKGLAGRHIG